MLKSALTTFYRIMVRHPSYAMLNLLGLGLGIAVFIILGLYVHYETSFESWIPAVDQTYLVSTRWTLPGRPVRLGTETMGGLADRLREDYPTLTLTRAWNQQASVRLGADIFHEAEILVDPGFFKVFDVAFAAGDRDAALEGPDKVVVSERVARKYLGRADAVGMTLRIADPEGPKTYVVSAVIKDSPRNTDLNFDLIRLLSPQLARDEPHWQDWGAAQVKTYLHFDDAAEARALEEGLDDFIDRKGGTARDPSRGPLHLRQALRLMPLRKVHLRDPESEASVKTMGVLGIVSFLIAAINFINLSTARAGSRAREVAVRRVLGATRHRLRMQFLGEALLMTLLACVIGLSLVELTLPAINAAGGLALSLDLRTQGPVLLKLTAAVLVLGMISGIYPAFILSGFEPASVLASSRTPSGGRLGIRIREMLVLVQFAVVIVFFILTWGFIRQLDHMRTSDLGFRREGLLVIPSTYDTGVTPTLLRSILPALRAVPGVEGVTTSDGAPGDENTIRSQNVTVPGSEQEQTTLSSSEVGPDFFQTFGATLLAGRFLDLSHAADQVPEPGSPAAENVVINAKAAKALGFRTPGEAVDQTVYSGHSPLTIVGVVEDLRFHSSKEEVKAAFYYFNAMPTDDQVTTLRYAGVEETEIRQRLTAVWKRVAPEIPLELISANDNLDKYYRPDRNRSSLFGMGAVVAALVGCIGLYGMAAFTTSRRMLEVAVRKVVGASRQHVVRLLVGRLLRPVVLANVIAVPVGYAALRNWLLQFNDRIAIGATPFLLAGGAAVAVALVTVTGLALRAAQANPGKALRQE